MAEPCASGHFTQQKLFIYPYEQHLTNLRIQGKRSVTIYGYSRAV